VNGEGQPTEEVKEKGRIGSVGPDKCQNATVMHASRCVNQ